MEAECPQRRRLVSTARKEIPRGLTSLEITDFHCHAIKKKKSKSSMSQHIHSDYLYCKGCVVCRCSCSMWAKPRERSSSLELISVIFSTVSSNPSYHEN